MPDGYFFKTSPFKHQLDIWERSKDEQVFALLMEQGTGKTKVVLDTVGYLWNKGRINCLVVIAPNGVQTNWDVNEIPAHLPDYIPRKVIEWSPNTSKKNLKLMDEIFEPGPHLRILCMNVEALATKKGQDFLKRVLSVTDALVAVDESTTIKNPTAIRTKAILKLAKLAKFKRIMTGTPITKSPFDAFSQFAFLDPEILGYSSYVAFKSRYARLLDASSPLIASIMRKGARFMPQIVARDSLGQPMYQNLDELSRNIKAYSARVLKTECLDLPAKLYQRRYYEMTPEQAKAYSEMSKHMRAVWKDKETTALNKLTMRMRQQQIVSGYFPSDDESGMKPMFENPHDNPKIREMLTLLEQIEGQVIIICRFIAEMDTIEQVLSEFSTVGKYNGVVSKEEREKAKVDFQAGNIQYLIGNKAMARGHTLTAATAMIFYSNEQDLEIRLQTEDRPHRIGQKNNVTYYDMECRGTVDTLLINSFRGKKNVADAITGDESIDWI